MVVVFTWLATNGYNVRTAVPLSEATLVTETIVVNADPCPTVETLTAASHTKLVHTGT